LYIKITKLKRKSKYAHENFTHHRTFSYKRDPWQQQDKERKELDKEVTLAKEYFNNVQQVREN